MSVERIDGGLFARYYVETCCERIWPALHGQSSELPGSDWDAMLAVSRIMAARIAKAELSGADQLWLHDFHVLPVAAALRERGWRGPLGYFQHAPLALVSDTDLRGHLSRWLQAPDIVAVQTACDAEAAEELGVAESRIVIAPVPAIVRSRILPPYGKACEAPPRITMAGRVDPTKGHATGMRGIAKAAAALGVAVRVRIHAPPSRVCGAAYSTTLAHIRSTVASYAGALAELGGALELTEGPLSREAMDELLAETDVLVVPSVADGMNLIAKEYVLLRGMRDHRLVLSPFVGARHSLPGAWVSNDAGASALADAVIGALTASDREIDARTRANVDALETEDPDDWMQSLVSALEGGSVSGQRKTNRWLHASGPWSKR